MTINARMLIAIAILTVLAGGAVYVRDQYFPAAGGPFAKEPAAGEASDIRTEPTDFAQIGTIVFNDQMGPGQMTPILTWDNTSAPLVMDAMSFCAFENGAVPCMAMSVTFDKPMAGRQALVEGNRLADGSVLVRKLRIGREGETMLTIAPGDRFISWPNAMNLIRSCEVELVMQTHALDIHLTLKSGERLRTVEPTIDEVFRVTQEATATCGNIGIATE
jgi:hypothetical protein